MISRFVLSIALLLSVAAVSSAAIQELGPLEAEGYGTSAKVAMKNAQAVIDLNIEALEASFQFGETVDNIIVNGTDWDGFAYTITYTVVINIPDP